MAAVAHAMEAGSPAEGGRKLRLLTLDDLDGRTRARQRAEELRERLMAERGGADRLDVMRTTHASTWALLTSMIEDQMARFLLGDPVEPATIATLVNARRREGEVIGSPEARDVTPSLAEFTHTIARSAAQKPAGESNPLPGTSTAPAKAAANVGSSAPGRGGVFVDGEADE